MLLLDQGFWRSLQLELKLKTQRWIFFLFFSFLFCYFLIPVIEGKGWCGMVEKVGTDVVGKEV